MKQRFNNFEHDNNNSEHDNILEDHNSLSSSKSHCDQMAEQDSDDSCFFADATLEDAHDLVDSPGGGGSAVVVTSSLFDMEDGTNNSNSNNKDVAEEKDNPTMKRITNMDIDVPTVAAAAADPWTLVRRKRPPIPRDIAWAAYATLFIPISLIMPFWITSRHPDIYTTPPHDAIASHVSDVIHGWNYAASSNRGHVATMFCAIVAYGASSILSIVLYRNPASGDDGEDARHSVASQITILSHYVSLGAIYPSLLVLIYTEFPKAESTTLWTFLVLFCFARDLVTLRKTTALLQDRGQGRRIFFRTLTCASLDILSRSLRRLSFYRIVSGVLTLQLVLVLTWRSALFVALSIPLDTGVTGIRTSLILAALLGGKWATSILARILGLIASGGVTVWFAQQQASLSRVAVATANTHSNNNNNGTHNSNVVEMTNISTSESSGGGATGEEDEEEGVEHSNGASTGSISNKMPDAYRTVDPNAYRSVNDVDDANMYYDDDDDDELLFSEAEISDYHRPFSSSLKRNIGNKVTSTDSNGTTAKHFLLQATTTSFGSVAQCALLGGLAQFVWSCLRNIRVAETTAVASAIRHTNALTTAANSTRRRSSGFQGMDVRTTEQQQQEPTRQQIILHIAHQSARSCQDISRQFVTAHTDLGMAHVAAYFKSYSRAALDVSNLVHSSGLEAIIHEDISSSMCASLCVALSGLITVVVGVTLSHHRGFLSDTVLCDVMVISFLVCYTICYTVMEPVRAAIKAVYVCFAQHPESLSQAFPLVFHRLSRIASDQ